MITITVKGSISREMVENHVIPVIKKTIQGHDSIMIKKTFWHRLVEFFTR